MFIINKKEDNNSISGNSYSYRQCKPEESKLIEPI